MATKYVEIKFEEMQEYLKSLGFIMHKRDEQTEWVANKIYPVSNINYIIRVYTSINPNERSRGSGSDAIRVGVFSSMGEWVFGSKRVNRTKNWKNSIKERIEELEERLQSQQEKFQLAEQI